MKMSKLTSTKQLQLKDAYDTMTFAIVSGKWANSKSTYYKISSPTVDGRFYERGFYDVLSSIRLSWVSKKYNNTDNKKKYTTLDHLYKPQFGAKFLLDNPTLWIDNFDKFLSWAEFFSSVIPVTKGENKKLSSQITNVSKNYQIHVPLKESYKKAGIMLFEEGGEGYDATPYDPFKNVPEVYTNYEKLFLV